MCCASSTVTCRSRSSSSSTGARSSPAWPSTTIGGWSTSVAEDGGGWAPPEPEDEAGAGAGPPAPPSSPPPGAPPSGWGPPPGGYRWARPDPLPKAGDARTGPLPLHPMNLSDVLDGAFKLYKANFRTVVAITAAFVVPLQLIAAFAQRNLLGGRGFMRVINDPS